MSAQQASAECYRKYELQRVGNNRAPRPGRWPAFDALLAHGFRVTKILEGARKAEKHDVPSSGLHSAWVALFSDLTYFIQGLRSFSPKSFAEAQAGQYDLSVFSNAEKFKKIFKEDENFKGIYELEEEWKDGIDELFANEGHPNDGRYVQTQGLLNGLYQFALAWLPAAEEVKKNLTQVLGDLEAPWLAKQALEQLAEHKEDRYATDYCPTAGLSRERWDTFAASVSDTTSEVKQRASLDTYQEQDYNAALCTLEFVAELAKRHARLAALQPPEDGSISTTGDEVMLGAQTSSSAWSANFESDSYGLMYDLVVSPACREGRERLLSTVAPIGSLLLATRGAASDDAGCREWRKHERTIKILESFLDGVNEIERRKFSFRSMSQASVHWTAGERNSTVG